MKKMGILSLILLGAMSVQALGNTSSSTDDGIQNYDENQLRFFQVEKELEELKKENATLKEAKSKELKLSGFVGTKLEVEDLHGAWEGGKVKVVLAEGSLRHQDYTDWSLFFHVAKEQNFSRMWNRSGRGQNTIVEIVPRYQQTFANDKGVSALELIYTSESGDNRDAFGIKPSVYYKVTDKFALNYYMLGKREFKGGHNDFELFENEPGFSYKINDNSGLGFNYFMKWARVVNDTTKDVKVSEKEMFSKPYIYYNIPEYKMGMSLWAEIGPFKKRVKDYDSSTLVEKYQENNSKFGISFNKKLKDDLTLVGEVSFKDIEIKKTETLTGKVTKDKAYIPFYMLGVQYSF